MDCHIFHIGNLIQIRVIFRFDATIITNQDIDPILVNTLKDGFYAVAEIPESITCEDGKEYFESHENGQLVSLYESIALWS